MARPIPIDRATDCHLLCFAEKYPPKLAQAAILGHLAVFRARHRGGTPWLVFAGESPMHWSGLTQWVLVSTNVGSSVFDSVCSALRGISGLAGFECTELTTPMREPFVAPLFCIQDDGAKLLADPGEFDSAYANEFVDIKLKRRAWVWS